MTNHLDLELLSEYLDGQLNKDEREVVRAHLMECLRCQQVLKELEVVRTRLNHLLTELVDDQELPPGWERRLITRFQKRFKARFPWWRQVFSARWSPAYALVTAGLIILALYLPFGEKLPRQPHPERPELETPQSLPSPEKEMQLFGLDQQRETEISPRSKPDRVRVFQSSDQSEVDAVYEALQKADLQPVRRGNEVLVEGINQEEAEKIVREITNK